MTTSRFAEFETAPDTDGDHVIIVRSQSDDGAASWSVKVRNQDGDFMTAYVSIEDVPRIAALVREVDGL